VFSTEALAWDRAAALGDAGVFVGPAVLDENITADLVLWPNVQFPNRLRGFVRRMAGMRFEAFEHSDNPSLGRWSRVPLRLEAEARRVVEEDGARE
jgi:hypothetical protein